METAQPKEPCFRLTQSKDGLAVRVEFVEAPPPGWEGAGLEAALEAMGIRRGILRGRIERIHRSAAKGSSFLVASGDPPVRGASGRIERLLSPGGTVSPRVFMDGSVDFREASRFTRVRKGTRLLRHVWPRPGIDGVDVRGGTIPAEAPSDCEFPPSTGLESDPDDPNFQVAAVDGVLLETQGMLDVKLELVIPGDVDASTGNVDFPGQVVVRGSVRAGFELRCGAGLEVGGSIEPSRVRAAGDLLVKEGILGGPESLVQAGGSLAARYAENARVVCGGDLLLEKSALNCQLTARGAICVRGSLVSGSAVACRRVEARSLGSPIGVPLHVCLGYGPEVCDVLDQVFAERVALERRWWKLADELARLGGRAFLRHRDLGRIPAAARERAREILKEIAPIEAALDRLAARQRELIRDEKAREPDAALSFSETLHSDVWINIGPHSSRFFDPVRGPLVLTGDRLRRVACPVALWVAPGLRKPVEEGLRGLGYLNLISPAGGGAAGRTDWLPSGGLLCLEPAQAGSEGIRDLSEARSAGRYRGMRILAFATGDPLAERSALQGLSVDAWVDAPGGAPPSRWFEQPPLDSIL